MALDVALERLAQPPFLQEVAQQHDGGVVAVHVAHLHQELAFGRLVEKAAELGQGIPGRLVEMDVLTGVDTGLRIVEQVPHLRLDENNLESWDIEQLLPRQPLQVFKGSLPLGALAKFGIRFDNSDNLVIRRATKYFQLGCVSVSDADLTDLYRLGSRLFVAGYRGGDWKGQSEAANGLSSDATSAGSISGRARINSSKVGGMAKPFLSCYGAGCAFLLEARL